ncbi:hypothetical protein SAMN03080615_00485 [Amphritea atlantica]|uniref:Uncharacterized protein n=1 Tax=Amphritea atlantica TaxID=355243 RepID=A0A1H9DD48_9GAMM|nr:hypothetical protein [Amphritea atlantica]SEQ11390.1 hypothetical protein SAMN03080615_00485 [Amphritea atlantica]
MSKSYFQNNIAIQDVGNFNANLIDWLIENSTSLNLLVLPVSVPCSDYKTATALLKAKVQDEIRSMSENTQDLVSNIGCVSFFINDGKAHGISITFGNNFISEDKLPTYHRRLNSFKRAIPQRCNELTFRFSLPLLRMCLAVYGIRHELTSIKASDLDEYALLSFAREKLYYSWDKTLFKVELAQVQDSDNQIVLYVRNPQTSLDAKKRLESLRFSNAETGLTWFDTTDLKLKSFKDSKKLPYKHYLGLALSQDPSKIQENVAKQLNTRMINEVMWNGLLEALLKDAGIAFRRERFENYKEIAIKSEYQQSRSLTQYPLGMDLSEIVLNNNVIEICYTVDTSLQNQREYIGDFLRENLASFFDGSPYGFGLKEFEYGTCFSHLDLVIGVMPDEDHYWKSSSNDDGLDDYGRFKKESLRKGSPSSVQFLSHTAIAGSGHELVRVVIENLAKRWICQDTFSRKIEAEGVQCDKEIELLVMGSLSWKHKGQTKSPTSNFSMMLYKIALKDEMTFSRPEIIFDDKFIKAKVGGIVPYLMRYSEHSSYAGTLTSALSSAPALANVIHTIDNDFRLSDTLYLFHMEGGQIQKVFSINNTAICLIPDMQYVSSATNTFKEQLTAWLTEGRMTRNESISYVGENKKSKSDAEYQGRLAGNTYYLTRKSYSENQKANRHLVKKISKIFDADQKENLSFTEADAALFDAGLMSDLAGAYKDSGVKKTIYEKIISLGISD